MDKLGRNRYRNGKYKGVKNMNAVKKESITNSQCNIAKECDVAKAIKKSHKNHKKSLSDLAK